MEQRSICLINDSFPPVTDGVSNLKQVEDINFEGKEKEVYDRAVDYMNDSKYYLEKKKDMRTAFGCIEYSHGLLDALRMIHGLI